VNSNSNEFQEAPSKYLLDTKDCKIPRTETMPKYYKKHWKVEHMPNCEYQAGFGKVNAKNVNRTLRPSREAN
jgi:hypothetical protein